MTLRQLAWALYPRPIKLFDVLNANARLAAWVERHASGSPHFPERGALFEHIAATELEDTPIDYLEFGVYRGASILWWAARNKHPDSRFYGFDSFEGLPESWELGIGGLKKGDLSTAGVMPQTGDRRVHFVKGWYQDSLPPFLKNFTPHNRLVVHCDSDLYSSTLYALTTLNPIMVPGTIVMFDEFCNHEEFRAFTDYASAYARGCRPIGSAQSSYKNMAIALT